MFRLPGILIGTIAFQTYAGVLSVRLPGHSIMTGDADVAQDFAVSREVGDSMPPILQLLQSVTRPFGLSHIDPDKPPSRAFKTRITIRSNS